MERAERVVAKLLQMDPNDSSAFVLMANIYAAAERFQDADNYRISLRGLQRQPGLSWCEFNGKVFQFVAHDKLNHVPEYKQQIAKKVYIQLLSH